MINYSVTILTVLKKEINSSGKCGGALLCLAISFATEHRINSAAHKNPNDTLFIESQHSINRWRRYVCAVSCCFNDRLINDL